jgi:CDP-diacylglycerol--serine O-phosphatidyltransferase
MKSTLSMFNIPNLFTASNMLCGILAILLSVSGRIDLAPFAIYLGAILDFFDGFLARKLNQQGELGKQMDSLADMITFGVAPGIMMMVLLASVLNPTFNTGIGTPLAWSVQISFALWVETIMTGKPISFIPFLALIIPFFSIFRLAKFNIDTRQSDSFIGLNTPANTIFFTSFPLLCFYYQGDHSFAGELVRTILTPSILVPLIILMSLLLVSEIPFFSFKFKHFKWKGNELRFLFLITCGILIPTILVWSIPIIILLYIILSVVENLFIKNKQYEV